MLERMILRLLGKERLDKIIIPDSFKKPKKWKMKRKRAHYKFFREFQQPIVISPTGVLIDGYTSYLIAKEENMKYVKVVRWRIWK